MIVELVKSFGFEAAHYLPNLPEGHKCRRLHGHSFRVDIHVRGPVDAEKGWLIDYSEIKQAVAPVIERLDHYLLNDIEGLENPTSEALCRWLWQRILPALPGLSAVVVHETCSSSCTYRGDGD